MNAAPALRQADRLLKLSEVMERTGVGRNFIYRKMAEGAFPDSVMLTPACVRWRESDIMQWMEALPHSKEAKQAENKRIKQPGM